MVEPVRLPKGHSMTTEITGKALTSVKQEADQLIIEFPTDEEVVLYTDDYEVRLTFIERIVVRPVDREDQDS